MLNKVAIFVLGILVGAASTTGFYLIRGAHTRQSFEQRLRCRNVAETYVTKKSDDYIDVFLDRHDFSKSRNSCLVSYAEVGANRFWAYEVVDVITGELLFTGSCDEKDSQSSQFCGNGRDMKLMTERDRVFDEAVK